MALYLMAYKLCQNLCAVGLGNLALLSSFGIMLQPKCPNRSSSVKVFFPLMISNREEQLRETKAGFRFKMKTS